MGCGAPVHEPGVNESEETQGEEEAVEAVKEEQDGAKNCHDKEVAKIHAQGFTIIHWMKRVTTYQSWNAGGCKKENFMQSSRFQVCGREEDWKQRKGKMRRDDLLTPADSCCTANLSCRLATEAAAARQGSQSAATRRTAP
jgi:hypothetical protein